MIPTPLPHPWSADTLLSKAQRYVTEMLTHSRDTWLFGLWSALALELLARAALAKVSPVLLANTSDPGKSWHNLYYALGHAPSISKFKPRSAAMRDVLVRLNSILPEFTDERMDFCVTHINRRNEELHSGDLAFDNPDPAWQQRYYDACIVLLGFLEKELVDLLGEDEAKIAEDMVAALSDEQAVKVKADIASFKRVWDTKPESERRNLAEVASLRANRQLGHRVDCPSCASPALLKGRPTSQPSIEIDELDVIERQEFLPTHFECVACGLKISGYTKLHASDLGATYRATTRTRAIEYFGAYEDYEDYGYEPDYNEY